MDESRLPRRILGIFGIALASLATPSWSVTGASPWTYSGGLSGGVATRIAMDATSPVTLYALVPDNGIYSSTDAGDNWTLVRPDTELTDMAGDPQSPGTVYITRGNNQVYKTVNGGASWALMSTGLPPSVDAGDGVRVFVDPVNEGVVYEFTLEDGIYKTTDGGMHWHAINTGIDSASSTNLIQPGVLLTSLTVDAANTQVLYLTAFSSRDVVTGLPGMGIAGVYKSTDGGGHWHQVMSNEPVQSLGVQPGNDQVLFASGVDNLYTSIDGGSHWTPYGGADAPVDASEFIFDPANSQQMWATGAGYLESSNDGGASWGFPAGSGTITGTGDAVLDPATGTLYAASSGHAVSKSVDGGVTWAAAGQGIHDVVTTQMYVGHDGALYLGTDASGLFRSRDSGVTWTPVINGIYTGVSTHVVQMVDDPSGAGLYLITGSIFKSIDDGDNWQRLLIPGGDFNCITLTPGNPSTIYTGQMMGVDKSIDDGVTWHIMGQGLPNHNADITFALASDPTDANTVFAGTARHGLYKSTDGATNWNHVDSLSGTGVRGLLIDPNDPKTIYASVDNAGIQKSTDGGASWNDASTGLNPIELIGNLSIDPADSKILIANSINTKHIYASPDGGAHWALLSITTMADAAAHAVMSENASTQVSRTVPLQSIAVDPLHKGKAYGVDKQGNVYSVNLAKLAASLNTSSPGTPGTPGSSNGDTGGGGGNFWLTSDLMLLGLWFARHRAKQH